MFNSLHGNMVQDHFKGLPRTQCKLTDDDYGIQGDCECQQVTNCTEQLPSTKEHLPIEAPSHHHMSPDMADLSTHPRINTSEV